MTGYTRKWNCKQCGKPQESIDWPKIELCESCERKLGHAPGAGTVNDDRERWDAFYGQPLEESELGRFPRISQEVLVKRLSHHAITPTRATEDAAAWDLYAMDSGPVFVDDCSWFHLGIALAIPQGYAGLVLPRSGLASKSGIRPANTPGLIDADYRGEVAVVLRNDSQVVYHVKSGDRIAQLLIIEVPRVVLHETALPLPETARGVGGFGSTGG